MKFTKTRFVSLLTVSVLTLSSVVWAQPASAATCTGWTTGGSTWGRASACVSGWSYTKGCFTHAAGWVDDTKTDGYGVSLKIYGSGSWKPVARSTGSAIEWSYDGCVVIVQAVRDNATEGAVNYFTVWRD